MGLYTLQQRRLRGDLIETFKILNGLEEIDVEKFFKCAEITSTRGHALKLYKPTLKKNLNCRKHFFFQRVINTWNDLPKHVINARTVNQLKNELDSHWGMTKKGYGVSKAEA